MVRELICKEYKLEPKNLLKNEKRAAKFIHDAVKAYFRRHDSNDDEFVYSISEDVIGAYYHDHPRKFENFLKRKKEALQAAHQLLLEREEISLRHFLRECRVKYKLLYKS